MDKLALTQKHMTLTFQSKGILVTLILKVKENTELLYVYFLVICAYECQKQ